MIRQKNNIVARSYRGKPTSHQPVLPNRLVPVFTHFNIIQTYTINNAYAAFEENLKGTLSPGKYADFIILSNNLLTIDEDLIPSTLVDMTYVGGELKYQRERENN